MFASTLSMTPGEAVKNRKSKIKNPDGGTMILLTRLNGEQFVLNAEKIRFVESTPDTVVCCESGERMMVKESLRDVMRLAIDYARTIRRVVTE